MKSIIATLLMSFCLLSQQAVAVSGALTAGFSLSTIGVDETSPQKKLPQMPCHDISVRAQSHFDISPIVSHQGGSIADTADAPQTPEQDCCEQDCQCCAGCGVSFINDQPSRQITVIVPLTNAQYLSRNPQTRPQLLFRPPISL